MNNFWLIIIICWIFNNTYMYRFYGCWKLFGSCCMAWGENWRRADPERWRIRSERHANEKKLSSMTQIIWEKWFVNRKIWYHNFTSVSIVVSHWNYFFLGWLFFTDGVRFKQWIKMIPKVIIWANRAISMNLLSKRLRAIAGKHVRKELNCLP